MPKRVPVPAPPLRCLIFYFESNLVTAQRQPCLGLWLSACRYEGCSGAPRRCRQRHLLWGLLFFIFCLTLCLQQGRMALERGLMVAGMRTDLRHRGGAGNGTLPLGFLIFDFESNFVPAARHQGPGTKLNGYR